MAIDVEATALSAVFNRHAALVIPEILAGRYQLLGPIGEGGMGMVHRAFDLELEEQVAVKFLRPELAADAGLRARFRREVKLARRVTHAHVARIFEFGHDGDCSFLTMEFIPGESLAALLAREAPLPPARVLGLALGLCEGLAAAHAAGVVHGDIKPANVLVDPDRGAVLTDFGIAQALVDRDLADISGTPLYMAPEQARGAPRTPATDVYAVGEVLFEALMGRPLWAGDDDDTGTLLERKVRDEEVDLSDVFAALPAAWTRLIVECLRHEPTQRPADAQALLARLTALRGVDDGAASAARAAALPAAPGVMLPWIEVHALDAPPALAWVGVGLVDALTRIRGLRVVAGERPATRDGPRLSATITGAASPSATGVAVRLHVRDPRRDVVRAVLEIDQPRTALHLLGAELAARIADAVQTTGLTRPCGDAVRGDVSELFVQARHAYLTMQTDRAEHLFAAALAAAPADPLLALWHTLARVQAALTFRDIEPAQLAELRVAVEAAIVDHVDLGEPHLALARIQLALGDLPGCARSLGAAIRRAPSLVEPHALLGDLLVTIGRLPDAERRLDLALMLDHGTVRGWLGRARMWAYQGRWDEFYGRAEPALAELRFRTPLLIRLMLWRPQRAVLERYDAELADNRESLPAPIWRAARDLLAFGLGRADPRAIAGRLAAEFTGAANPHRSAFFSQIVCELHCSLGDPAGALEFLELADRGGLTDWQWIEACPVLAPLRAEPRFAAVRSRVRTRADAVADAIWS